MHRICELAPEGHIVMIDPHGEYSAAFKNHGELFNVDNLAMPYWLMNFEEHCEVFITSSAPSGSATWTSSPSACSRRAPRTAWRRAEQAHRRFADSPTRCRT
jgi:hypothetical protein